MRKAVEWVIFAVAMWDMFWGLTGFDFVQVQVSIIWAIIAVFLEDYWED
jgi:hypothetical protein